MRRYFKQMSWTAVLAAATAFGQTPPEPPQTPATPPAEAPESPETPPPPRVRVRPARPPKIAKAPTYAYAFSNDESGSYLGVGVRDVTHDVMAQLNLHEERGVEVTSIDSEGPAAKAGLKEHDVILTFNGDNVESYEQMRRMIHETPAGRKVKLGISRAGRPMSFEVTLGKREEWSAIRPNVIQIPKIEIPPMNFEWDMPGFTVLQISSRSGATVEDLTPQLGDFFGAKNGEGVLVRSVERGSPAETAGLKAGDVIVRVGSDRISNSSEWRRLMRQHRSGAVPLTILRDRREQTLSLKLPERRSSDAAYDFQFPEIDLPTYNAAEVEKLMKQVEPDLERTRVALANLKLNQKQFARDLERSMKQMERDLERQQKELLKEHQD